MGIISVEQSGELYWLGRYTERAYTTIRVFAQAYDEMIDGIENSYEDFCRNLDIPDIYGDKDTFIRRYPFDLEDPNSIRSNLERAYDNAIVLRETIHTASLSYIQMAIYDMEKAAASRSPLLELQKIIDHLLAFYGIIEDQIENEQTRNLIKAGKRIERVDLYARLALPREKIEREVRRLSHRIERCGIPYDREAMMSLQAQVSQDPLDDSGILKAVNSIL